MIFSLKRLKLTFISSLISWAGLIANVECSFVRILMYSLRVCFLGGRFLFVCPFFLHRLGFPLYIKGFLLGSFYVLIIFA